MSNVAIITDRDKGYAQLLREVSRHGSYVLVGVLGSKAAAAKKPSKAEQKAHKQRVKAAKKAGHAAPEVKPSHATVAQIAAYQEFGTKDAGGNIPARSFLAAWFDENKAKNIELAKALALDRLVGRRGYLDSLRVMGAYAQGGIQKRIADGLAPKLAESTIARRKGGGSASTKPLIDTGQLRSSIAYQVVTAGGV